MSETSDLNKVISELNLKQEKMVSLPWTFYRGIFYGLGFFVGGTVIVGILIYILTLLNGSPVIGDAITKILKLLTVTQ